MTRIFLIGYRATGKTSVGKRLSDYLSIPFYDLDEMISNKEEKKIAQIVETHGWDYFRQLEREFLQNFMESNSSFVLSCGGGAVIHVDLWENLRDAKVIWLKASIDRIVERIESDPQTSVQRPRLTENFSLRDEVAEKLGERTPLYGRFSNLVVDTTDISIDDVVRKIIQGISKDGR